MDLSSAFPTLINGIEPYQDTRDTIFKYKNKTVIRVYRVASANYTQGQWKSPRFIICYRIIFYEVKREIPYLRSFITILLYNLKRCLCLL
jgi:hypothetical protein